MRILDSRAFLTGFAAFVFFSALAADAWRNSISWYGYGVVVAVIVAASIAIIVRQRASFRIDRLPWPLLAFLALALLSVAWSHYRPETLVATATQSITSLAGVVIALVLSAEEIARALSRALRAILALSLIFELVVSLVVRAPVFPVWVTAEDRVDPPRLLYWSRNLLLEGDRIQGIVRSSSLLAMVALLALIVFGIELVTRSTRRPATIAWLATAALVVALTRSATIYLGIIAVLVVLGMILLVRRAHTSTTRRMTYAGISVGALSIVAAALVLRSPILEAFGKSEDLTGRLEIWGAVIGLAEQRPALGWGWVSFWPPWRDPFDDLVVAAGVQQLHAHNAWLDVWLQLGVVGLVVFGALVITTGIRSWLLATDRVVTSADRSGRFSPLSLLAPLIFTALLVQSLAESRLLIEGGWLLLVVIAVTTKLGVLGRLRERAPADRVSVRGPSGR